MLIENAMVHVFIANRNSRDTMNKNPDNSRQEAYEAFTDMMENHPELFYDTSELDDMEDGSVTHKNLEEWLEEIKKMN